MSDSAAGMLNVSSHGLCVTVYYKLPMLYVVIFYFLTCTF